MAPFWDDINLNSGGIISYETFESGYYLEQVNTFIQRQRLTSFNGTWMMNVYYQEVAPFSGSGEVNKSDRLYGGHFCSGTLALVITAYW